MASCKINLIFQNTSIPNAPKSVELHFNAAGWILDTEALIQHNETLRIEAEKSREINETKRNEEESKRSESENTRVQAESARVKAEEQRVEAEIGRDKAETLRVQEEGNRVDAENQRAYNENIRNSNETNRVRAESTRVQNEAERVNAESNRIKAESARDSAENDRCLQEKLRKEAETLRVDSENGRKSAEQSRVVAEQNRATAEQARVTAEQQRVLAEQTRAVNESARQKAEAGRQAAETKREENTAVAIRNSEEAAREAEDEAARVRTLADNPPKIVEVDGVKYWASWNEATGQYVVSENRADVGDAVLFSSQVLTSQQREQARVNIGAFAKNQFAGPQYYAVDTSLFPQISSFNPEDTIYDDETDTIYSILNFPINLLVAVQNLKVVKAHTYSMVYERNDSSLVLIGNYIYATIGGNMTFLRRINKETLEEEMAVSYSGKIDGLPGCGLYVAGQKLFLRAKDNILYLVDKDELTLSDTGFHGITTICNVTKDVIAFADGSDIYLYDGESVINQISIPAEYSDIKYLNNYRGKDTTEDLKYLIASLTYEEPVLISIGDTQFYKGTKSLIPGGFCSYVGYKRVFNILNGAFMCIASKNSCIAGTNSYVLNRPEMSSIFQIGFYLVDAYLYGSKDIYCTYGGYFMR